MFILLTIEISEGPEIAADIATPTALIPATPISATPIAPVSATPTAPIPTGPVMSSFFYLLPYLRYKFVLFTSFIPYTTFHISFQV